MKIKNLTFFILFNVSIVFAQSDNLITEFPSINPPSPTAYELGKYGETPIGLYTGAANISIPLLKYGTKNIPLSISLSYSSNGIKVDQLSSNVGLGWSLNAGGVISRTVRGRPDEERTYQFPEEIGNDYMTSDEGRLYFFQLSENPDLDSEPDIFTFNFMGRAGKFVFDNDGGIVLLSELSLKIINNTQTTGGFIIIDESGKYHYFEEEEQTRMRSFGASHQYPQPTDITAWYLSKIVSPLGDTVYFQYENNGFTYVTSQSQSLTIDSPRNQVASSCSTSSQGPTENPLMSHEMNVIGKRVTSITSNIGTAGTISFEYSQAHPGVNAFWLVSKIKLTDPGRTVEEVDLSYLSTQNNRIFLESVQYQDSNKNYQLEYIDPNNFPERLSFNRDEWGYYNGKNNQKLYPDPSLLDQDPGHDFSFYFPNGADKRIDESFAEKGLLKKITYPTKGFTQFFYESNTFNTTETIVPEDSESVNLTVNTDSQALIANDHTILQNINTDQRVPITLGVGFNSYDCSENDYPGLQHRVVAISVENLTAPQENIIVQSNNGGTTYVGIGNVHNYSIGDPNTFYLDLKANMDYEVSININKWCLTGFVYFSYDHGVPELVNYNKKTGGLRISQVLDYVGENQPTTSKRYYYAKRNELSKSSGIKGVAPIYVSDQYTSSYCTSGTAPCVDYYFTYKSLNSSSLRNLYDSSQQTCQYQYVTISGDDGDFLNGGEEFEFKVANDPPGFLIHGNYFEPVPQSNIYWGDGLELRHTTFKVDSATDSIIPLREVINEYHRDDRLNDTIYGFSVRKNYIKYCITYPYDDVRSMGNLDIMGYYIKLNWYYQSSRKTVKYDLNGENPVEYVENYYFDNPQHLQLTRVETVDSQGEIKLTRTYYPDDVADIGSLGEPNLSVSEKQGLEYLKSPNLHLTGVPIQQESILKSQNGSVLSRTMQRTLYTKDPLTNLVLPRWISSIKGNYSNGTNPLLEQVSFDKYDSLGNLLQVSRANGNTTSYIWGYDRQYPVAVIENATRSQIEALADLGPDFHAGPGGLTTGQEDILRSGLPNSMVTTYAHLPLTGITEMTDPRGKGTFYSYDSYNRLKEVKDDLGQLLNDYLYNYRSN